MNLSFVFTTDILFYPLLGYYLVHKWNDKEFKRAKLLYGVLLAAVLLGTVLLGHFKFTATGTYTEEFHNITTWILAVLLFLLCKDVEIKNNVLCKIFLVFGSCALGVYLIEDVVRNQWESIVYVLSPYLGDLFACIVFVLVSLISGTIVIWLVKKIPFVNKLI